MFKTKANAERNKEKSASSYRPLFANNLCVLYLPYSCFQVCNRSSDALVGICRIFGIFAIHDIHDFELCTFLAYGNTVYKNDIRIRKIKKECLNFFHKSAIDANIVRIFASIALFRFYF